MAEARRKGPLLQFAGVVLLSLGLLNILLSLKSGSTPDYFYLTISTLGAACLGAGLWRARN